MTRIVVKEDPDESKWENFVKEHPLGNIFQSPQIYHLYNSIPRHKSFVLGAENEKGEIVAILVGCLLIEKGLKRFFSARAIISGGPLVRNNDPATADTLLHYYNHYIRNKAIYTQFRNIWPMSGLHTALENNNYEYEDHLTVIVDLLQSVEEIEANINKKRFSSMRGSVKKGVIVKPIEDPASMAHAIHLIELTYKRIKLPAPPQELFTKAAELLKPHIRFFGSFFEEKLIGVRICLNYNGLSYDWYAASDLSHSKLRPNDLLPLHCIKSAKDENLRVYNFGGAGKPDKPYGVRDFKMQYGGKLVNYGRYTLVHKPLLYRTGKLGIELLRGKLEKQEAGE